ncbi:MAG TPA: hypothetical protein VK867_00940 [Candidatus Limnocylindrales bacterium]|nr:hypothetical protein [Candidatus Limnocylindrales bacterium]
MTAQSIVCGTCAAEVPYGRLSCPSCGELLASVAGSRRSSTAVASRTSMPDVLYEPPAAPSTPAVVGGQLAFDGPARAVEPPHATPLTRDVDAELPWGDTTTTDGPGDAYQAALDRARDQNGSQPAMAPWVPGASLAGSPTPSYMPRPDRRERPAGPIAPEPDMHTPEPDLPPALFTPAPALTAAVEAAPLAGAPAATFAGPGAYVPPLPVAVLPAGMPAPAREYAGHPADVEGHDAPGRRRSDLFDGDARARVLDFARWLSVAGSAFAAVGFLLPWGLVVIGSSDVSYFGRWGIAGPWHIVVVFAVLANLGLALLQNRVPVWWRTGLTGLGLGALLLGLVWPYIMVSALGTGPGAIIAGIGAAALVVSGLLALVTERHAEAGRPV